MRSDRDGAARGLRRLELEFAETFEHCLGAGDIDDNGSDEHAVDRDELVVELGGLAQASAACSQGIKQVPTLTAGLKKKAEAICSDLGAGNIAGAHKAAGELCREVVSVSSLPTSSKEQAEAACKSELSRIAP